MYQCTDAMHAMFLHACLHTLMDIEFASVDADDELYGDVVGS